jgi:hypothetical protein
VAFRVHHALQDKIRSDMASTWRDNGLVFCTGYGTELDAANVRRAFRKVTKAAGLDPPTGHRGSCGIASCRCCPMTACQLRRSPALSATPPRPTTELVYHQQIRPVVQGGAEVMDRLFPGGPPDA